jgi:uncharacterized protein
MSIWSRILFFTIVLTIIFGLQYLVFRTLNNFLKKEYPEFKYRKAVTLYPFIIFNIPIIYILLKNTLNFVLPAWIIDIYAPPFYIYQTSFFIIGLFLLIGKIIKAPFAIVFWFLKKLDSTREKVQRFLNKKEVRKFDKSRRTFIRASTAAITGYAFIGSTIGYLKRDNYEITHKEITIENLPPELKGTRITLISDIHSGPYMDEKMMREYADVINDIGSDLILIPGDLTNSQTEEAYSLSNAFRDVKADKGIYASLGNHDYFSNANYIADVINNESPVKILRNDSEAIEINGKKLLLLGVEDTRDSGASYNKIVIDYLDETIDKAKLKCEEQGIIYEETPKILLYHKPYIFPDIADRNLDLMVSGHTHGGQIVLAKFGSLNLSLAATVSEFISGFYREGKFQMYLSRGIGMVGLPIRLNCPPEITVIKLV